MADSSIKCVVWDLDNTIWNGTLLENSMIELRENITEIIHEIDNRGILQSIASRNEEQIALAKLKEFELEEYFLFPQIHWNSKAESIDTIAKQLNIGIDSLAFIDDRPEELAEVAFYHPEVHCIHADQISELLKMQRMVPPFKSENQLNRRLMYQASIKRDEAEKEYSGSREEFLSSLEMVLTIFPAKEKDLERAEELTVRTNQLNATGRIYSKEELNQYRKDPNYLLLMAKLEDRFGDYGHIALALVEKSQSCWTIKVLLSSCRVMSRGIGTIILTYLIHLAQHEEATLLADFIPTDKNRVMRITYQFAGFKEIDKQEDVVKFQYAEDQKATFPEYMEIITEEKQV